MDQVAEQLAELRERRALTLRELSDMSSVAADTINQIELGHRKARPSTLRKLARALEIDVQEFYAEPALPKAEAPRGAGRLEQRAARSQPSARSGAEGHLAIHSALEDLEENLTAKQVREILEGVRDGRITVEAAARRLESARR